MSSSSASDLYLPEVWEESHLRVIRARLIHFKQSKRLSWESLAQRVLLVDSLPKSFVNNQSLRSLGESLRRFGNAEQDPEEDRLNAIALFLHDERVIKADTLKLGDTSTNAAAAFDEFAFGEASTLDQMPKIMGESFRSIETAADGNKEVHATISLSAKDRIIKVVLKEETFVKPNPEIDLDADERARRRSLKGVKTFHGWCARTIHDQAVAFLKNDDYGDKAFGLVVLKQITKMSRVTGLVITSEFGFQQQKSDFVPYHERGRTPRFSEVTFSVLGGGAWSSLRQDGNQALGPLGNQKTEPT
ncbi:MAG: hypothetical protein RIA64_08865 [Rhodospirillales bacterium]